LAAGAPASQPVRGDVMSALLALIGRCILLRA
jgi:hypothetical protein